MPSSNLRTHLRLDLQEIAVPGRIPYSPMVVDLVVDASQGKIGQWLVFGWFGSPGKRDADCWPLVIDSNGKIDFGSSLTNDIERYGHTDLFNNEIVAGQRFKMKLDGEVRDWSIARVHRLDHVG